MGMVGDQQCLLFRLKDGFGAQMSWRVVWVAASSSFQQYKVLVHIRLQQQ
jgi:hypothetical protein